jgi:hypothetical protein
MIRIQGYVLDVQGSIPIRVRVFLLTAIAVSTPALEHTHRVTGDTVDWREVDPSRSRMSGATIYVPPFFHTSTSRSA